MPPNVTLHAGRFLRGPKIIAADVDGPTPNVNRNQNPHADTASKLVCKSAAESATTTSSANWPAKWESQLPINVAPGHACTNPSTRMLKSNGESTLPWAMPESCQGSGHISPARTCHVQNVQSRPTCALGPPWRTTPRCFHPRGVESFEDVHKRNESVGGRPHVQHI